MGGEIQQLRLVFEQQEARERELRWRTGQTSGELDSRRMVDLLAGERNVFMRRLPADEEGGGEQRHPKRLTLVVDCSRSMSRFNAADRRLDRTLACLVMLLESLAPFSQRYELRVVGHDGGSSCVRLKEFGDVMDRARCVEMLDKIVWNASFCETGDNTLAATAAAVDHIVAYEDGGRRPADERIVLVLSDANLNAYGVSAVALRRVLARGADGLAPVKTSVIFVSGGRSVEKLCELVPRVYVVTDTRDLPRIVRRVLSSNVESRL